MSPNGTACIDVNECVLGNNACTRPGTCLNTPGSYECCTDDTYSTGTECAQCYTEGYTYDKANNTLPETNTTSVCFGTCKSGFAFGYVQLLSPVCPILDRKATPCSYPCANATFGMNAFDAVNTLYNELHRGGYIDELLGDNSTDLVLSPMSIALSVRCDDCDAVLLAASIIAPGLVLERTMDGLSIKTIGVTKSTKHIIVAAAIGTCAVVLALIICLMLSRDRTYRLHESLAKTIRVPFWVRLTRRLLSESLVHPSYIEGIVSVKRVYNTVLLDNFVGTYLVQKERMSNKVFHKKSWSSDPNKSVVHNAYLEIAKSFQWNTPEYPTVISVMHGTSVQIAEMIAKTGFAALSTLDSGWYGTGIYFTSSFEYCLPYIVARPRPAIIVSYVLPGNVYPVVKREDHEAKPIMSGYQSHYVRTNIDGKPSAEGYHDEVVISQESQILPLYIVEIKPLSAQKFVPLDASA